MFGRKSSVPVLALAVALVTSGCLESQKSQANAGCKTSYVGREKSACEIGVNIASETAKKEDGKTRTQKYQAAVDQCGRLERPLVKICVSGVNNFRNELAKIDSPKKQVVIKKGKSAAKTVAATGTKSSRAPASVK